MRIRIRDLVNPGFEIRDGKIGSGINICRSAQLISNRASGNKQPDKIATGRQVREKKNLRKRAVNGSVMDLDPYLIRIQWGPWIRIQEGKNDPQGHNIREKLKISFLKRVIFSFDARRSIIACASFEGLEISKLHFFQLYFFNFSSKAWIRITWNAGSGSRFNESGFTILANGET